MEIPQQRSGESYGEFGSRVEVYILDVRRNMNDVKSVDGTRTSTSWERLLLEEVYICARGVRDGFGVELLQKGLQLMAAMRWFSYEESLETQRSHTHQIYDEFTSARTLHHRVRLDALQMVQHAQETVGFGQRTSSDRSSGPLTRSVHGDPSDYTTGRNPDSTSHQAMRRTSIPSTAALAPARSSHAMSAQSETLRRIVAREAESVRPGLPEPARPISREERTASGRTPSRHEARTGVRREPTRTSTISEQVDQLIAEVRTEDRARARSGRPLIGETRRGTRSSSRPRASISPMSR